MSAFESAYQTLLRHGRLLPNPGQAALVQRLAALSTDLSQGQQQHNQTRGVYIFGGVGTGKSRIADLFCATLPSPVSRRRAHFHEFMLDIHTRLHRARSVSAYNTDDPLPQIGRDVCAESRVLCFDEFQVTDIADAMILQRLFSAIWREGGVMVSTSNRHPDSLYENGLNRALFLPFIAELKRRSELWRIEGATDYRMQCSGGREQNVFTDYPDFQQAVAAVQKGVRPQPLVLQVMMGRTLTVSALRDLASSEGLTVFASFAELCETNLGAADYHALCRATKTLFLHDMPCLSIRECDYARRFITLVDLAYEAGTRVVVHVQAPLANVFGAIMEAELGQNDSGVGAPIHKQMSVRRGGGSSSSMMSTFVSGNTEWSATGLHDASLAAGGAGASDVAFAISRALSRLHEMGSSDYHRKSSRS